MTNKSFFAVALGEVRKRAAEKAEKKAAKKLQKASGVKSKTSKKSKKKPPIVNGLLLGGLIKAATALPEDVKNSPLPVQDTTPDEEPTSGAEPDEVYPPIPPVSDFHRYLLDFAATLNHLLSSSVRVTFYVDTEFELPGDLLEESAPASPRHTDASFAFAVTDHIRMVSAVKDLVEFSFPCFELKINHCPDEGTSILRVDCGSRIIGFNFV
jgi:hypothetical protein